MDSMHRHDTLAQGPLQRDRQRQCRFLIGRLLPSVRSFLSGRSKGTEEKGSASVSGGKKFT